MPEKKQVKTVVMEAIAMLTLKGNNSPHHLHHRHRHRHHRHRSPHQQLSFGGGGGLPASASAVLMQFVLLLVHLIALLPTTSAQQDLFVCTFEQDTCGLINDPTGNFLWMRYRGNTPTDYTGPSSGQGGSEWYFYAESSAPRQPNDQARFTTPDLNYVGSICVRFYYNAYGQGVGQLVLYTQVGSNYANHVDWWRVREDQGPGWKFQWFELTSNDITTRVAWNGVRGLNWLGDIGVDTIRIFTGKCVPDVTLPWACDFETDDLCGMRQRNDDDFEWFRWSGTTPTAGTGPASAESGTYYVYIETSEPLAPGTYAALESPVILYSGDACVMFWYNMYGSSIGILTLYTVNRGQGLPWRTLSGNSGSQNWTEARVTVQLTNNNDRIGFIGVRGNDIFGDIAVDNVRIFSSICPGDVTTAATTTTSPVTTASTITTAPTTAQTTTQITTPATTQATTQTTTQTTTQATTAQTTTAQTTTAQTTTAQTTTQATTTAQTTTAQTTTAQTTTLRPTTTNERTTTTAAQVTSFNNGTHIGLPWSCDFERDECGMEQMNYVNTLFTRQSGPSSPTGLTGPTSAQQGLYYMFINSTSPRKQGDNALLETWYILYSGWVCVRFWYNMYGVDTGRLILYTSLPGRDYPWRVWSGNHGPQWLQAEETVNITGDRVGIIAEVGPGPLGQIAVDNINITARACNDTGMDQTPSQTIPRPRTTLPMTSAADVTTTMKIVQPATSSPGPLQYVIVSCDMESDGSSNTGCRLRQDQTDDFDWTLQSGMTPSGLLSNRVINGRYYPVTGPSGAEQGQFYLFTEASGTVNGEVARLIAEGDDFRRSVQRRCLHFYFCMNGFHTGTLRVYARFNSNPIRWTQWQTSGDKLNGWKSVAIDFNMTDVTEVGIEGIMSGQFSGDTSIDNLTMNIGQCQVPPPNALWTCSFELPDGSETLCGMVQALDDQFDWTLWSGTTPSEETGPSQAFSLPYFIYTEASDPRLMGDRAEILVPKFYQVGPLCVTFYYNMNGFGMGSLEVYTVANGNKTTLWSQSGNHGDVWLRTTVTVSVQYDDQIGFRGIRGSDYSGDSAIDSIVITNGFCISS